MVVTWVFRYIRDSKGNYIDFPDHIEYCASGISWDTPSSCRFLYPGERMYVNIPNSKESKDEHKEQDKYSQG
jgi:hypothetical protein